MISNKAINSIPVGIYEKALPFDISWQERLDLTKQIGFDFLELSIDESDERLSRLNWNKKERFEFRNAIERSGTPILDLCLSAHRKFALGSADESIRKQALDIFHNAIEFTSDVGIRIIQVAGYYVYYEDEDQDSEKRYQDCLAEALVHAEKAGVMLAIENVDGVHINSVSRAMKFINHFNSPWLQVYPDIGNLTEQGLNVIDELEKGRGHIVAVHVKDVKKGQVRRIPFGEGLVNFESAFTKLDEMKFKGPVLIEMWNDNSPQAQQIVKNSLQFIKEKMRKGGLLKE